MHSWQHDMRIARVNLHNSFNIDRPSDVSVSYITNNGGPVGGQLVGASRIDQPRFEAPDWRYEHGPPGDNDYTLYLSGWGYPGRFGILNTVSEELKIIEDSDFSFMNRVKLWRNYAFLPLEIKYADDFLMDDLFKGVVGVIDITDPTKKKILDTSSKEVTGLDSGNEVLDGIYTLAVNCDNLYVFPPKETRVVVYDIFWIIKHLFNEDLRSNDNPCDKDMGPQGFVNNYYNKFNIDDGC